MRIFLPVFALLVCTLLMAAQEHSSGATKPALLLPGMGNHHHPISTTSPEAQRFFDQGLTLVYAFNHDEAVRSLWRLDLWTVTGYHVGRGHKENHCGWLDVDRKQRDWQGG